MNHDALGERLPAQVDFNQDAGGLQARRIVDGILAAEGNAFTPARSYIWV
jgi:hypothetical protein